MAYRWARWLQEALREEGCDVVPVEGWQNRGRWRDDDRRNLPPNWDFEPNGLFVWHHTAATATPQDPWPSREVLIRGRPDLDGPLSQVSPDHHGRVHLIAAGRCNHAGELSGAGPTREGADGNTTAIGCEIDTSGTQQIPLAQYRASIRCAAAVNRRFGRGAGWSLGHEETSVTGKWDPGEHGETVDLDSWRRDVAECLSYRAGVWHDEGGLWSWGRVRLDALREGGDSRTVRRLQHQVKRAAGVPGGLRSAVKVDGTWSRDTREAVAEWQRDFARRNPGDEDGFQGGRRLGPRQARELFPHGRYILQD